MNKRQSKIYDWFMDNKGYLKKSAGYIFYKRNSQMPKGTKLKDIEIALSYAKIDSGTIQKLRKPMHNLGPRNPTDTSKFRRLFFDIETSYNIVKSWRVGFNINLNPGDIIHERAIICVSWKWQGDPKVYNLTWDNGCDKKLLEKFVKVMNSADEVCGHNGDKFDIKWIRTRCLINGVPMAPEYKSIDTLKLSKSGFNFNSNKLDYLGRIMGVGNKIETGGLDLWDQIILPTINGGKSDKKAMNKMVEYCNGDIVLLEKVFNKLNSYTKGKSHVGVIEGKDKCSCPNCGSDNHKRNGVFTTYLGTIKQKLYCSDCGQNYTILMSTYNKYSDLNMK